MTSYLKWEDLGIICVPNMENKGSMKESSKLGEVIQLAKSIKIRRFKSNEKKLHSYVFTILVEVKLLKL